MRKALLSSLLLAVVSSVVACGGSADTSAPPVTPKPADMDKSARPPAPTKPDSDKVAWKQGAPYASCHNDVKTGADLVAGVTAMATACAGLTKMHQIGQIVQGTRQNLDPAQAIPLHAEANHCYRAYGLSENSLQDLDIAMVDSTGKSCGEDGSDSPDAVVLEDGVICFSQADDVKVNVAAGSGGGKFAVEIWGD
ncbi:MAG TPA: hypothetical protein VIJ22_18980 [Polyangiaceae bacterium]